jgi:hypothetical protein
VEDWSCRGSFGLSVWKLDIDIVCLPRKVDPWGFDEVIHENIAQAGSRRGFFAGETRRRRGLARSRLRFAPPAATSAAALPKAAQPQIRGTMRAEVERLVEEIKQSVGLLRRHL